MNLRISILSSKKMSELAIICISFSSVCDSIKLKNPDKQVDVEQAIH